MQPVSRPSPKIVFPLRSSHALQLALFLAPVFCVSANPTTTVTKPGYAFERTSLLAFGQPDMATFEFRGSAGALVTEEETTALDLTFETEQTWPNIRFLAGKAFSLSDWSKADMLAVTVTNRDKDDLRIGLRVDPVVAEDGKATYRQGVTTLSPGETATLVLTFSEGVFPGMRGQPRHLMGGRNTHVLASWGMPLNVGIASFQLFMRKQSSPRMIRVRSVELLRVDTETLPPFVDRFGQYTEEEWPGKLHSVAEFATRLAAEEADLAATPKVPGRSAYGG